MSPLMKAIGNNCGSPHRCISSTIGAYATFDTPSTAHIRPLIPYLLISHSILRSRLTTRVEVPCVGIAYQLHDGIPR